MKSASNVLYILQGLFIGGALGVLLEKVYKIDTVTSPISFSTILLLIGVVFFIGNNILNKKSIKH